MTKVTGLPWLNWVSVIIAVALATAASLACSGSETADPAGPSEIEEPVEPLPPALPEENGGASESGAGQPSTAASCRPDDPDRVSWVDVEQYLNRKVAVLGPVSAIQSMQDGSVVLDVGDVQELPDAEPVKVILLANALNQLPSTPEDLYSDEVICVVGVPQRVGEEIHLLINEPGELLVL